MRQTASRGHTARRNSTDWEAPSTHLVVLQENPTPTRPVVVERLAVLEQAVARTQQQQEDREEAHVHHALDERPARDDLRLERHRQRNEHEEEEHDELEHEACTLRE